jgi:uncharacterized membrane protein
MSHPLKHVENLFALIINAGAAVVVAGGVLSLIEFIEASIAFAGINHGYDLPKNVSLLIAIAVALFATWKVNGRFITRGD